MKKGLLISLYIIFNILFVPLNAQEDLSDLQQHKDTIATEAPVLIFSDSLTRNEVSKRNEKIDLKLVEDFQPNPTKAVIYSAIFPGLGQIYNRKYWKLPIVYGGFLGVVYAVTWNGNMYSDYQNAYKDISLGTGNRWYNLVLEDPDEVNSSPTLQAKYKERFKSRRDYFRRNRDLAIIVGVGLYALCMIDAYVDAHLYNFTVTPDLSMTMAPVVWGPSNFSNNIAIGLQCNIVF